jgi:hypothetical protein
MAVIAPALLVRRIPAVVARWAVEGDRFFDSKHGALLALSINTTSHRQIQRGKNLVAILV